MLKYKSTILIAILLISFVLPANILAQSGGTQEIKELSEDIKAKQVNIEELRSKIDAYQESLAKARSQSGSLKNQIYILETQIQKKEAEIELNQDEIDKTNLEIKKTEEEIRQNIDDSEDKKSKLSNLLREIYRMDQKSDIEIVIMNESLSEFFSSLQATETVQINVNKNLIKLKSLKKELESKQVDLEEKNEKLGSLNEKLTGHKGNLEGQQSVKQSILSQARSSEQLYQNLVSELKLEQNRINAEIVTLEKAIRQKLAGDKSKLSELGDATFAWPVPNHYITASFHDPDYPFRHIFEHPAIDIRAAQGTPTKAADSGYVGKVRDGGAKGYSYIMLIHDNGFSTVYGHMSKFYVTADSYVSQGDIIGLSGGMPGTSGAGRLSTGPHMHFEVRLNGIPVNPLDYLP